MTEEKTLVLVPRMRASGACLHEKVVRGPQAEGPAGAPAGAFQKQPVAGVVKAYKLAVWGTGDATGKVV